MRNDTHSTAEHTSTSYNVPQASTVSLSTITPISLKYDDDDGDGDGDDDDGLLQQIGLNASLAAKACKRKARRDIESA